jgi:hypothetical protein
MKTEAIVEKILGVVAVVAAFTFFDYLVHTLVGGEVAAVPSFYYTHKIVFASIYAIVLVFLLDRFKINNLFVKSAIFAVVITLLLQLRYLFFYNYSAFFHEVVIPSHILILFIVSSVYFSFEAKQVKKVKKR